MRVMFDGLLETNGVGWRTWRLSDRHLHTILQPTQLSLYHSSGTAQVYYSHAPLPAGFKRMSRDHNQQAFW